MAGLTNGRCINMDTVAEGCKKRLKGPDDDEYEGDVPVAEIEKDIVEMVNSSQAKGEKCCWVFDGYSHKSAKEFMDFATPVFGSPSWWLPVSCDVETASTEWKKLNDAEDVPEEALEEIKNGENTFNTECEAINKELEGVNCKVHATLDIGTSAATTTAALKALT